MKPVRALRVTLLPTPAVKVTIVRKTADLERRRRLVRLLAMLLDKPDTPDDGERA